MVRQDSSLGRLFLVRRIGYHDESFQSERKASQRLREKRSGSGRVRELKGCERSTERYESIVCTRRKYAIKLINVFYVKNYYFQNERM